MRTREIEQILKENGFVILRQSRHTIWTDGMTRIVLPNHRMVEMRLSKQILINIRKALAFRDAAAVAV